MAYTQDNKFLSISQFGLGDNTFLPTKISGTEAVSKNFEFEITVLSHNMSVKPDAVVGKTCDLEIKNKVGRVFNGVVKRFSLGDPVHHDLREYHLTVVPWFWLLELTQNQRIFQNKTTKQIIEQVFKDRGFNDFDYQAAPGMQREYCVQYAESDHAFVCRLLEEEGAIFFFTHEKGRHKLVISDRSNAFVKVDEGQVEYNKGSESEGRISSWGNAHEFQSGAWTLTEYDYSKPNQSLIQSTKSVSTFKGAKNLEQYAYADISDLSSGSDLVRKRISAAEAQINKIAGEGNCASFFAGGSFSLKKHDNKAQLGGYHLIEVSHLAADETYVNSSSGETKYSNHFTCVPDSVHYRIPYAAGKARMRGPQSALVVGPKGEEIYVDKQGRIKVQFYWDREGQRDESTTCWIRVMQSWAGNGWGASFIPRIGHEVIVDFIDGDPDKPIITGTVYNGTHQPPFGSKTQSGFRSRSSKGGGRENFNELRFDDKKDAEQIYVHAEKNMDSVVENDESRHVMHDRRKTIDNDQFEKIGNNKTTNVGKVHEETVGENHIKSVGNDVNIRVSNNHTETIGNDMVITVSKNNFKTVEGDQGTTVTKAQFIKAKTILLEAEDKIVFQTGKAKIVMQKNGDILVDGKNINILGSGNVVVDGKKTMIN